MLYCIQDLIHRQGAQEIFCTTVHGLNRRHTVFGEVFRGLDFIDKIGAAAQLSVDQLVDRYADLASVVQPRSLSRLAPDSNDDV